VADSAYGGFAKRDAGAGEAAKKNFGEFARLNFTEEPPVSCPTSA
jgi:hypothetical protein